MILSTIQINIMTLFNYLSFLLSLCILASACNKKTTNSTINQVDKTEKAITTMSPVGNWIVVNYPQMFQQEGKHPKPQKQYPIRFNTDHYMGLKLDINNCETSYQVQDRNLIFKEGMTCTEACCDTKEAMGLSGLFSGSLEYSIKNSTMTITSSKGPIELIRNEDGIQGTSWEALSFTDLKNKQHDKFAKKYTLTFDHNRLNLQLDVNSCNVGVVYNYKMSVLEIESGMGCTRKCCDSEEGLSLSKMLSGRVAYKKTGKQLVLTTAQNEIILTAINSSDKE